MLETGSTDCVGGGSSVHTRPTIQSYQTADFQAGVKQADSVGILAHFIPPFRSLVIVAVFQPDFDFPSLHRKIPFPAACCGGSMPSGRLGNNGSLGN
jgi:hypothetical protein